MQTHRTAPQQYKYYFIFSRVSLSSLFIILNVFLHCCSRRFQASSSVGLNRCLIVFAAFFPWSCTFGCVCVCLRHHINSFGAVTEYFRLRERVRLFNILFLNEDDRRLTQPVFFILKAKTTKRMKLNHFVHNLVRD